MPITYHVNVILNLVRTAATGAVSNSDLIQHVTALAEDPRIQPGYRELFDARSMTHLEASLDVFDQMAEIERHHLDKFTGTNIAIVIQDAGDYAYAEQFEQRMATRPVTVTVFNNIDIAMAWLGLSTDIFG